MLKNSENLGNLPLLTIGSSQSIERVDSKIFLDMRSKEFVVKEKISQVQVFDFMFDVFDAFDSLNWAA